MRNRVFKSLTTFLLKIFNFSNSINKFNSFFFFYINYFKYCFNLFFNKGVRDFIKNFIIIKLIIKYKIFKIFIFLSNFIYYKLKICIFTL